MIFLNLIFLGGAICRHLGQAREGGLKTKDSAPSWEAFGGNETPFCTESRPRDGSWERDSSHSLFCLHSWPPTLAKLKFLPCQTLVPPEPPPGKLSRQKPHSLQQKAT